MTVDKMICRRDNYCEGEGWSAAGGRSKQQATNVSGTARQASSNRARNNGSGLTSVVMISVVIFYRCWLYVAAEKDGRDFFGVEFKLPRFSLSHRAREYWGSNPAEISDPST